MIDLNFETYFECKLSKMNIIDSYPVQQWTHVTVSFTSDATHNEIEEPEALMILNESGEVLQIVLQEEGCDSANFQFTESEKKQLTDWLLNLRNAKYSDDTLAK